MVYWQILGAWKKKNKFARVIWRAFDVICVGPLTDHGQQPMKMHTEVTLLYNKKHMYFYKHFFKHFFIKILKNIL